MAGLAESKGNREAKCHHGGAAGGSGGFLRRHASRPGMPPHCTMLNMTLQCGFLRRPGLFARPNSANRLAPALPS